ncbi:hypothetical protein DTO195F2_5709 [Paecilomyces variotii]|nr:hypothetical protein DTO195F2_5709 [Paecilomyces variotii]
MSRYELMLKTMRLLQRIRGPTDELFANFECMAQIGAVRTLLAAGVFHAIPAGGKSISAAEISAKTGLDKEILIQETYSHTSLSEAYLVPQLNAVFTSMADELLVPMAKDYEFLAQNNWKDHITTRHNPYTYAHGCEGNTMFEFLSGIPSRFTRFNEAMVAQDSGQVTMGIYPFALELAKDAEDDRVTIVDVGGGRGHILQQIKENCSGVKGKFILQDQAGVVAEAKDELARTGIEAMTHDFFQPQPVKGALVYYLRRILHDWPESESKSILQNLAASMDHQKSRVLITEFIVPEVGSSMLAAWMDQAMMTFGGTERTEKNFERLLDISGLKIVKVWKAPGTPVGIIEAILK